MAEAGELPVVSRQEYRVKLGKSFTFPKENAFHTIMYDFKPQSVDPNKPGRLRVTDGDEVNVSLPQVQAESVGDVTQFRGPKKSTTKECVLIIDTQTGEAILEKISNTVQLKRIRDVRKPVNRDRSISPSPFSAHLTSKPSKPPPSSSSSSSSSFSSTLAPPGGGSKPGSPQMMKGSKTKAKSHKKVGAKAEPSGSTLVTSSRALATPSPAGSLTHGGEKRKKTRKMAAGATGPAAALDVPSAQRQQPQQLATPASMPVFGMGGAGSLSENVSPDTSPLVRSTNPTPDPVPTKKLRLQVSASSSSSSSGSSSSGSTSSSGSSESSSEEDGDDRAVPAHPQSTSVMVPDLPTHAPTNAGMGYSSGMRQPQFGQTKGAPLHQAYPGQLYAPPIPPAPSQAPMSASSSSSSSGSGSDNSSDSSASSSDGENDREVAAVLSHAPPTSISQQSLSIVRTDLNLSDSGSDSDE